MTFEQLYGPQIGVIRQEREPKRALVAVEGMEETEVKKGELGLEKQGAGKMKTDNRPQGPACPR